MDSILKIALIGEYRVGKTKITIRFVDGVFSHDQNSTKWGSFGQRTILVNDHHVKIEIWDTAGEEKFNYYNFSPLKKVDGLVLVYKVSSRKSFEGILNLISLLVKSDVKKPTIIVGTKIYLENREVTYQEAQKFAELKGFLFSEVCSETNENIDESFASLAKRILKME